MREEEDVRLKVIEEARLWEEKEVRLKAIEETRLREEEDVRLKARRRGRRCAMRSHVKRKRNDKGGMESRSGDISAGWISNNIVL